MRSTFILTWNPDKWPIDPGERAEWEAARAQAVEDTARGGYAVERWSTGSRTHDIRPGCRAFLLRQHRDRGIVAAGTFTSEVYPAPHWDGTHREANFADVQWDSVLSVEDRLVVEELHRRVSGVNWDRIQGSGVQVHEPSDQRSLEELWEAQLGSLDRPMTTLPEQVPPSETLVEGAVSRVEVNRYERDPKARKACIDHWGFDCSVCGFNFVDRYGTLGQDYIHVHHLVALSTIGDDYEIDPVADLRPVCPNCHAMLHRERPALPIDRLRAMIRSAG
jgi:5-methylcytosine-specific restriction protein A